MIFKTISDTLNDRFYLYGLHFESSGEPFCKAGFYKIPKCKFTVITPSRLALGRNNPALHPLFCFSTR